MKAVCKIKPVYCSVVKSFFPLYIILWIFVTSNIKFPGYVKGFLESRPQLKKKKLQFFFLSSQLIRMMVRTRKYSCFLDTFKFSYNWTPFCQTLSMLVAMATDFKHRKTPTLINFYSFPGGVKGKPRAITETNWMSLPGSKGYYIQLFGNTSIQD